MAEALKSVGDDSGSTVCENSDSVVLNNVVRNCSSVDVAISASSAFCSRADTTFWDTISVHFATRFLTVEPIFGNMVIGFACAVAQREFMLSINLR